MVTNTLDFSFMVNAGHPMTTRGTENTARLRTVIMDLAASGPTMFTRLLNEVRTKMPGEKRPKATINSPA